jgi:hypothetical protein
MRFFLKTSVQLEMKCFLWESIVLKKYEIPNIFLQIAEQILNSKLSIRKEIEKVISSVECMHARVPD